MRLQRRFPGTMQGHSCSWPVSVDPAVWMNQVEHHGRIAVHETYFFNNAKHSLFPCRCNAQLWFFLRTSLNILSGSLWHKRWNTIAHQNPNHLILRPWTDSECSQQSQTPEQPSSYAYFVDERTQLTHENKFTCHPQLKMCENHFRIRTYGAHDKIHRFVSWFVFCSCPVGKLPRQTIRRASNTSKSEVYLLSWTEVSRNTRQIARVNGAHSVSRVQIMCKE